MGGGCYPDNPPVHLLIPFAAPLSDTGRAALRTLELPRLRALLARLSTRERDDGDAESFTPPHERALARALGLAGADGQLPWGARLAQADGIATGDLAWGLVTPAHWHLGTDQVSQIDPAQLMLDDAASRAFHAAVQDLFTSEGWALEYGAPLRWYAAHESLAELRTASPDRVIGRNVDRWLAGGPAQRLLRRLQQEVQMLLYTHPLNDERSARGLPTVNSFWLSGCGRAQPVQGTAPRIDDRLRGPALAEDWAAWCKAWEVIDGALDGVQRLTLCGERAGVSCTASTGWRRWWSPASPVAALLETL